MSIMDKQTFEQYYSKQLNDNDIQFLIHNYIYDNHNDKYKELENKIDTFYKLCLINNSLDNVIKKCMSYYEQKFNIITLFNKNNQLIKIL